MMRAPRFLRVALAAGGALAAAHHALNAADVAKRLQSGETIRGDISGRVVNSYEIALEQGQYARVVVEHHGIALILRLVDAGVVVNETRTDEADGREVVEVASERATVYQIHVATRFPKFDTGSYAIAIGEIRAASERDRLLHEARGRYAESNRLFRTGAYANAQSAAERALEIRERLLGEDHGDVAAALDQLGMICAARNEPARAETLYRRALAINERVFGPSHQKVAEILDSLVRNARISSDYTEGERLGRRALAIRSEHYGADHPMVAPSLRVLVELYLAKSDYRTSEKLADQALGIVAAAFGTDDEAYADSALLTSQTKAQLGNYARAEELALVALKTTEQLGSPDGPKLALLLANLANVYFTRGDNVKAETTFQHALAIYRKSFGDNHVSVSLIFNNLGLLASRRGDNENAESYLAQALAIRERLSGPNDPNAGAILNNLGLVAWRTRNHAKATAFYQRALEINETIFGPDSIRVVAALINLAIIAADRGDYPRAEADYKRGLAIEERELGPNHPQVGVNVEGLGGLYRDQGDYSRAEPLFRRGLAIVEQSLDPKHPTVVRSLSNLAQIYSAQGDLARALPLLERIVAVQEKNLPLNLAAGSERQKLAYFEPLGTTLDKVISFQIRDFTSSAEARDLATTALLQRKGRILDAMADSLGALRRRSGTADVGLLDELSAATSQLATLVVNGPQRTPAAEYQQRIKTLAEKREALEIDVSRRSSGYYEPSSAAATLAAVREAIPADAALVEFAVYRPFDPRSTPAARSADKGGARYAAFVIHRTGEIGSKDLGLVSDVDQAVAAMRLALRDPRREDVNARARALDEAILQPLREMTGDATRLLISPDGALNLVPFEALVDERGRYLVERYAISYLTTGRDLLRLRVARASRSEPLIVADPTFGEPPVVTTQLRTVRPAAGVARRSVVVADNLSSVYFAPLTGTGVEARAIKSLFPEATLLAGDGATEAALARAEAPRILHIATHGFFLNPSGTIDNPLLRSGLALKGANLKHDEAADGILTALEASNLNLWGTKLVTLSACDTGVGEVRAREGVYGLRRAFFLAGAETLVMSLWPVSDLVTREIMTAYYGGLRRGVGRGDALRQAQLVMLARANRRHPFYWASFIQAGEWANLDGRR
jgi:CHAT domain-containing protein/Tfp pilus assembly protein PilF